MKDGWDRLTALMPFLKKQPAILNDPELSVKDNTLADSAQLTAAKQLFDLVNTNVSTHTSNRDGAKTKVDELNKQVVDAQSTSDSEQKLVEEWTAVLSSVQTVLNEIVTAETSPSITAPPA